MKLRTILIVFIVALVSNLTFADGIPLINGIQDILPEGWTYTVIDESGEMGHPNGLVEPIFRIDFLNSNSTFFYTHSYSKKSDKIETYNPYLRIHFHPIGDKEKIMKTIEIERVYSWDIPMYFGETKEYIIITSPGWINHGIYTEEAKLLYAPLEETLKKYFEKLK